MSQQLFDRRRQFLSEEELMATSLLVVLNDIYGGESYSWAPETIRVRIYRDFRVNLSANTQSRMMVGISLVNGTLDFYRDASDFNDSCRILAGESLYPGVFVPSDVADISWGVVEATLLTPPESEDPFSEEVIGLIEKTLTEEGFVDPPDVLRFVGTEGTGARKIDSDWMDSPETLSLIWSTQREKKDLIDNFVRTRLQRLVRQLDRLPLENKPTTSPVEIVASLLGA